jgi:hypothetical protein
MGVADEQLPPRQHQHLHGGERAGAVAQSDHVSHIFQVLGKPADGSAQHGVGFTLPDQHGPRSVLRLRISLLATASETPRRRASR